MGDCTCRFDNVQITKNVLNTRDHCTSRQGRLECIEYPYPDALVGIRVAVGRQDVLCGVARTLGVILIGKRLTTPDCAGDNSGDEFIRDSVEDAGTEVGIKDN